MNSIEEVNNLDALKSLLAAVGLPVCDIDSSQAFFGIYSDRALVAVIGLELLGSVALLRSLAVSASHRNQGLAKALVHHAETYASAQGVTTLFLLTTTAQPFFERLGFASRPRVNAPPAIAATAQFSSICSDSAAFLSKSVAGITSSSALIQAASVPAGESNLQ